MRNHGARVVISTVGLQFAFGLVFAWGAAAPYVQAQDHWPALLVGAVFSGTPLGYGTGMVVGGRLADGHPPRRLCWIALTLLAIGFSLAFLFPSGLTFVLFYSVLGLGFGGGIALAAAVAAATQAFPARVGGVGGLLTAAYAAVALVQIPLISSLSASAGWLTALRVTGTGMMVIAAAALLLMPALPPPVRLGDEKVRLLNLVRRPGIWNGILVEMSAAPLGAYAFVNVAGHARAQHLGALVATLAVGAVALGNVAGRIGGGLISDRAGPRPVLLVLLACDLAAALLLAALVLPEALIFVTAAAAGLTLGGAAGVMTRLAAGAAPDAPHSAFGLLFAGYAAGAFSGPLLGAAAGGGPGAWLVVGSPALIGLGVLAAGRGVRRRAADPAQG